LKAPKVLINVLHVEDIMKKYVIVAFLLVLASCAGGGARVSPELGMSAGEFTLTDVSLLGEGRLVAAASQTAGGMEVAVSVEGARGLKGAQFTLRYPGGKYHATGVRFSEWLGGAEEVVQLGIVERYGEVPVGMVKVRPQEAVGVEGSGELVRVSFARGAGAHRKAASRAPGGEANKPRDLKVTESGVENLYLVGWHEVNAGDGNNDGTVNISDVTPIAMHFGESYDVETEWTGAVALIDSNTDGSITIADVTGIAMNFGTQLAGYNIYLGGSPDPLPNVEEPGAGLTVLRPVPAGSGRVQYTYQVELGSPLEVRVRPADGAGAEGIVSDPAEYEVALPPAPPTGVVANSSAAIGIGKVLVTWTPSVSGGVVEYRVYRSDGGAAFAQVGSVGADAVPLAYRDGTEEALLPPGVEFTYYVTAVNAASLESSPSNEEAVIPYYPDAPTPPSNLTVTDDTAPYGLSIILAWEPSQSEFLSGYYVQRKAEGEADFTVVDSTGPVSSPSYMDGGLTEGVLYTYRVQAFDDYGQTSGFSNEESCCCSPYVEVQILSVDTPQSTYGAGELAVLTADVTNAAATVTWSASSGCFPQGNQGKTVRWQPPATPGKPTVYVHADDGLTSDDSSLQLTATTLPNLGPAPVFTLSSRKSVAFADYLDDRCVMTLSFDDYC